jgi:excinuclease ABC subunit C
MDIKEIWKDMPRLPGVYLMKNSQGGIIYVGKAKNLRARVGSYFSGPGDGRYMVRFLIPRVQDIDFVVTDTEKEALILENTLIKKYRPRYNVMLRDDKTYFSLRLDTSHPFPRFTFVRKVKKDGARYFGPYSSALAARETHRLLHKLFPLRLCGDRMFKNRRRPCIYCQMRRCPSPCIGQITQEEYAGMVNQAVMLLEGHSAELLNELEKRMNQEAEAMHFEEAALLRDRIQAVRRTVEKQKVVSHKFKDMDIFALHREGETGVVVLMSVRGGILQDSRSFDFPRVAQEDDELPDSTVLRCRPGHSSGGPASAPPGGGRGSAGTPQRVERQKGTAAHTAKGGQKKAAGYGH